VNLTWSTAKQTVKVTETRSRRGAEGGEEGEQDKGAEERKAA
jgi:hypothetical protein